MYCREKQPIILNFKIEAREVWRNLTWADIFISWHRMLEPPRTYLTSSPHSLFSIMEFWDWTRAFFSFLFLKNSYVLSLLKEYGEVLKTLSHHLNTSVIWAPARLFDSLFSKRPKDWDPVPECWGRVRWGRNHPLRTLDPNVCPSAITPTILPSVWRCS